MKKFILQKKKSKRVKSYRVTRRLLGLKILSPYREDGMSYSLDC